ncbi:NACHT domain-containing protein [Streptomyces seoulensis]|uniref:NACHT domain-containing protein n=1 Tax=Streptomyces seoulensis TaxID=73044 RepID=UPI003C2AD9EF
MATNQVLNDGKLSWTWLYASLCVTVLSLLYSESGAGGTGDTGTAHGGRRVYLRQLRASVRDMETVGIATQSEFVFRMRQVYVDVSVVPQVLHAAAREPYVGPVGGSERRSLASVLREGDGADTSRVLAVIGGPGSGKTTLARNTALELCAHRWRPWRRRLPVLLYLRDHASTLLADQPPALETVAVSAGWLDGKVPARWLARRLDRGGCVVLLDGLDEVADPAERGRVVAWVARQVQRHPRNTYVVTSRPHGYETNPLPGAEVLQVRRFTWEQIERFLRQWSYATESRARGTTGPEARTAADRTATDLLTRLRRQPALYDLAANPLLLTMTANVHRYRGQLPGSRAELYAEMCDVLLHRRSEARGLTDATGLTGPHKQHVAQHLALAMMRARVRDWPVRDAARAIRLALRQVPGHVSAEVFLQEARKSGLLVEREHDVYAFAHLTLQEYLAAAQLSAPHADTGVLTENVGSPWWRETILLWAAGNDATPVITACLENSSVPALALAFDCADEARTVEPDTHARLEALLAPPRPGEPRAPEHAHLMAEILATRSLRETVRIDETSVLCARPVPYELYAAFVTEETAAGRHHHDHPVQAPASVAVGMQAGDAERFVDWVNSLGLDSEIAYRLPTRAELSDAAALVVIPSAHTVWARDRAMTLLHQPEGAPWPYSRPAGWIGPTVAADVARLDAPLRLMATPEPNRPRVIAWTKVLAVALTNPAVLRQGPVTSPLKLPFILGMATAIDDLRVSAEALTDAPETVSAFLRAFDVAYAFTRAVESVSVVEICADLDPLLARALGHAHSLVRSQYRLLADGVTDPNRIRHVARSLDIAPTLARTFRHAYRLELDRALGYAQGIDQSLVQRIDVTLEDVRHFDPSSFSPSILDFAHTPTTGRSSADPREPLLDIALLLAVDLTRDPGGSALALAGRTLQTMAGIRMADAWGEDRTPERADLETFLATELSAAATHLGRRLPQAKAMENPLPSVRLQRDTLRSLTSGYPVDRARILVEGVTVLLDALHERTLPWAPAVLACARTALIAALIGLDESHARQAGVRGRLYLIWESLAALEASLDSPTENQILLLAHR